ncbi:hypothetical protein RYZ27_00185 [Hyphomonas sp. FCG-A18]|uniref:hypothetical protein n=1 Tax=Hyphomonas sp. FCG-A18 TaxID=3080019 RepID=UPI002B2C2AE8|nr:hypothetical protein RYZ27_00185 [Hyphomonas sp. FCG-A18]
MFDRADLRAAVGANVLSADQASRLEAFLISRHDDAEGQAIGQENLRFLANFNDIFITIGLVILFIGITTMVGMIAAPSLAAGSLMAGVMSALVIGSVAWGLLEYFCGRRRLLLPSMALTLAFAGFISLGLTAFYATTKNIEFSDSFNPASLPSLGGELGIVACLSAFAAAGLVFFRFRLPFSLAVMAVSIAGAVYTFLGFFGDTGLILGGTAFFSMGLLTLAAAIWFDMQDPERIRKPSDNAFWLHLAAAPQVIWGISTIVTGSNILSGSTTSGTDNATQGITLLIVLLLIGIVSLALNRRALIAASLITFIAMLSFVLDRAGLETSNIFITVTILIGTGVVLLGAGWKTARRAVLVFFPKGGTWNKLFPAEPA